ncbi:hypothetical protein [Nocardia terpenica]|uniref:Uncharacterized protein n=1 Tax=Nocardia terpenica TaxID=455432 RepID=A0A164MIH6_9NOCA|nr:hypothetical protein [Nocardia terpenica]KZM73386.1 hypothetical protein AWN90_32600 [Nocardia terpenica]NQE87446.1 hypothetical protein [Nocardia terpenica]
MREIHTPVTPEFLHRLDAVFVLAARITPGLLDATALTLTLAGYPEAAIVLRLASVLTRTAAAQLTAPPRPHSAPHRAARRSRRARRQRRHR